MATTTMTPIAPLPARKRTRTPGEVTARMVKMALLIFFAAVILMPVYVLVVTSIKSAAEYGAATAWALPTAQALVATAVPVAIWAISTAPAARRAVTPPR